MVNHSSVAACLDSSLEFYFLSIDCGLIVILADTWSGERNCPGRAKPTQGLLSLDSAEQAWFLGSEFTKAHISNSMSAFQTCGYLHMGETSRYCTWYELHVVPFSVKVKVHS